MRRITIAAGMFFVTAPAVAQRPPPWVGLPPLTGQFAPLPQGSPPAGAPPPTGSSMQPQGYFSPPPPPAIYAPPPAPLAMPPGTGTRDMYHNDRRPGR